MEFFNQAGMLFCFWIIADATLSHPAAVTALQNSEEISELGINTSLVRRSYPRYPRWISKVSTSSAEWKEGHTIPLLHFFRIHVPGRAQMNGFSFRKSDKFCQRSGISHRKFVKHVQGWMRAIFFNRQNSGHIGKRYVTLILQKSADKVEIQFLRVGIWFVLPENAVPLIYNENESFGCLGVNIEQDTYQILRRQVVNIRKGLQQITKKRFWKRGSELTFFP